IGTTSPYAKLSVAGQVVGAYFTGTTTATSTFGGGLDIASGCYAVNGTCLSAGGGSGTVGSGTAGQFPYYAANGTTLTATSSLFLATSGRVGVGTTNPGALLEVSNGTSGLEISNYSIAHTFDGGQLDLRAGSDGATIRLGGNTRGDDLDNAIYFFSDNATTRTMTIENGGNVGIGTTNPSYKLQVANTSSNGPIFQVDGTNSSYANVTVDNEGRASMVVHGEEGGGSTGGAYFSTNGYEETWYNLLTRANTSGQRNIRFGNKNNQFRLDVLNDAGSTITTQGVFTIENSAPANSFFVQGTTGYFGLGDATPQARLSLGTNIATDYLDNYNEYQIVLYEGGSVADSYGLGIIANTMVFNSGGGAYRFDRGGSATAMVIDTTGKVGIGTTSPYAKFSVAGSVVGQNFNATSTTATSTFAGGFSAASSLYALQGGKVGIGKSDPTARLEVKGSGTGTDHAFLVTNSIGDALFSVQDNGYVGVGTSSPAFPLSFAGYQSSVQFRLERTGSYVGRADLGADERGLIFWPGGYDGAQPDIVFDPTGKVGIGKGVSIDSTLTVQGSLCVRDTGTCGSTAGTIYATTASISDIDLAENYRVTDETIVAGEIVSLDISEISTIKRAEQGETIIGVISTNPGLLLGQDIKDGKPVALKGRIPVKVNMEGGEIVAGDAITLSSTAGIGMKATSTSQSVGIALEGAAEDGVIEMFVQNQRYVASNDRIAVDTLIGLGLSSSTSSLDTNTFLDTFFASIFDRIVAWFADTANGIGSLFAREVHTEKICVAKADGTEVCLTGDELQAAIGGTIQSTGGDESSEDQGVENTEVVEEPQEETIVPEEDVPVEPAPEESTPEEEVVVEEVSEPAPEEAPSESTPEESAPEPEPAPNPTSTE
ncbi:DUF2190 family protein, partial [Candidatus Parcubacteria bacterium]|nr:DUF2190 family protein [Candidatus Parcubacteria bacterium]